MKGKYFLVIENNRLRYELTLERNITIIKGASGTGKSILFDMFRQLNERRRGGTFLSCNMADKVIALTGVFKEDLFKLNRSKGKIIIVDEGFDYADTREFTEIVQNSDNYFIFITRLGRMHWLTYSVDCIYELGTERRGNVSVTRLYKKYLDTKEKVKPSLVITEDSNSGFEAMKMIFNCDVASAHGKDNIYQMIESNIDKYSCIYCLVDGAAFGNCIGRIMPKFSGRHVYLFAPESFEFLLLTSKTFENFVSRELTETYDYCDSTEFVSWERYYTDLLSRLTKENYDFTYSKSRLQTFFKSDYYKNYLKGRLTDVVFD